MKRIILTGGGTAGHKPGSHIRFMDDRRDMPAPPCGHDRHRHEAAFGEDNVGLEYLDQVLSLAKPFYHTERVCKIPDA